MSPSSLKAADLQALGIRPQDTYFVSEPQPAPALAAEGDAPGGDGSSSCCCPATRSRRSASFISAPNQVLELGMQIEI